MLNRPASRSADLTGHTHLLQTSLRILIALALAMISLPFLSTSASAAPANGIVIDGNRSGTDDWIGHIDATGYATVNDQISVRNKDDDVFKGSHEAHLPSTWGGGWGSPSTGDDIGLTESFTAVDATGNVFFYLGFARKTAGVGAFVVELNQEPNEVVLNRQKPTLNFTVPDRTAGDVRITFSQGNGNGSLFPVGAAKWNATTGVWDSVVLGIGDYDGKASSDDLFAELEINLTAAGLRPPCGATFTQVNVRSRASNSDSALHDYVTPLLVGVSAPCRSITVEKYDASNTNAPLGGASFQLFRDDGDDVFDAGDTQVGTPTSQESADEGVDGNNYTWNDLPWGTYFVKESTRPVGYEIDPDANADNTANTFDDHVQKVTLGASTPNGIAVVRFENPQTMAQIRVEKYAKTTGNPALPGAKFKLYQDDGDNVFESNADSLITDVGNLTNGEVTANQDIAPNDSNNAYTWTTKLAYGRYFVVESQLPAGYDVDPNSANGVRTLVLGPGDAGATVPVKFYNPPLAPKIQVSKFDGTTGDPLTGASFTLYLDNGDNNFDINSDTLVSGPAAANQGVAPNNNTYTWDAGLSFDTTYFVEESVVPNDYDVDPGGAVKEVTVSSTDSDSLATVEFNNPQKTAQIRVEKFGLDLAQGSSPLSGARFELWKDADGDGDWTSADVLIRSVETADDDDGTGLNDNTYTWPEQLSWGDYLVKEITAPTGYDIDPLADDGENAKLVHIMRKDAGSVVNVQFFDPQSTQLGERTIKVTKTDADTLEPVDGATFELYLDEDGDEDLDPGEPLLDEEPTSLDVGIYQWTVSDGLNYLVKEATPPTGYLPPAVVTQTVPSDGVVGFTNSQERSTITVTKTDAGTPGLQVDGATFELWKDGAPVINNPPSHTAGTGVYTWSGLLMGDYTVTETIPPPDYLPPSPGSKTQSVSIVGTNAGDPFSVGFQNEKKATTGGGGDPVRTGIVVTKRDLTTNQPIDTATFQLWEDANANGTFEAAVDAKVSPAKNTANGVVSWVGLLMGTYFVEETAAPNGYELPANTVLTIIVDGTDAGGTLSRSFYDPQMRTTIELVKQDDKTGRVLAGAVFQAYVDVNEDGTYDVGDTKIGGTKTSGTNGVVSWSGLKFGHYVIREVAPPDGYGLAADTDQSVVLDRDNAGETVQLVFLDPAEDGVAISKVALEQNADGEWVPSDGEVAFGDLVKYEITADAYGATMYRDVNVSDFIPGYDPADTKSTTKASYVNDSATCGSATCAVSFDDTQQLSWSLGDMRDEGRTLEFVVRMPLLAATPVYDETGLLIETIVNVAELSWQEGATESMQRRAAAYGTRSIRSNEVVTTIVDRPEVLDTPPAVRPETVKKPGQLLPDTGAPTHSAMFGTVGSLSLLLGAWLMLVSRGRGYLPQR